MTLGATTKDLPTKRSKWSKINCAAKSPRARRAFENLDGQNRYAIFYRPHDAKRPETRLRRLEQFVATLEAGRTLH